MKNRTKLIRILLKSVGVSIIIVLVINFTTFLLGLIFYGLNEAWVFHFKHSVFSLNGRIWDLKFFEPASIGLMSILFIAAFANELKNPSLINKPKEEDTINSVL